MAGAISINVAANVRDAVRGVDNVADAVEEVSDRLRDMTKDSDQSADRLERDFKEVQRSTDKTSDDIKRKFRDAYKSVGKSSDDAADDAARAQRRMSEQSEEVGQEIRQNLGEGIANAARGDFEGLADVIGDTLGGAVAGIGGIGTAAIGAAGALGLGAIVGVINLINEEAAKSQQAAYDLANAYIDAGTTALDAVTLAARVQNVLTDPEARKEAEALKDVLGVDLPDAARILAGDTNALAAQYELLRGKQQELNAQRDANRDATAQEVLDWQDAQRALDAAAGALDKVADRNTVAAETARAQSDALKGLINDAGQVTEEIDELGNVLYTLPDGKQILINADTGMATTNIDTFKGDLDGIPVTKDVDLRVRTNSGDAYREVDRLVSYVNGRVASIRLSAGIGGRQLL